MDFFGNLKKVVFWLLFLEEFQIYMKSTWSEWEILKFERKNYIIGFENNEKLIENIL